MPDIESILSIIRKKKNDLFNLQIKAVTDGDFPCFENAMHKIVLLREYETRITLIAVEIKSLRLEVQKIAEQADQV